MTGAEGIADDATGAWRAVGEVLDGQGWRWRAVAVEHLAEASARVAAALHEVGLTADSGDSDGELLVAARAELPPELPQARSIVIGALAQPVTQAVLVIDGREHTFVVPPHYAGYEQTPRRFATTITGILARHGFRAVQARVPLKTLAVACGLARYGRNNIAYVDGLGSYLALAACATDLPAPAGTEWVEAGALAACDRCVACARACPTGAIPARRAPDESGTEPFVLRADRCLTSINEDLDPIPDWVDPAWHSCAVGCLRCQQVCPANAEVELRVEEPVRFSAAESAAILAGDDAALRAAGDDVAARLAACGLDYDAALIARNLRLLLPR